MGTIGYENQLAPLDFQGPSKALQTPQEPWRFTGPMSVSLAEPVPRSLALKKKRKLFLELSTTYPSSLALPPLTVRRRFYLRIPVPEY